MVECNEIKLSQHRIFELCWIHVNQRIVGRYGKHSTLECLFPREIRVDKENSGYVGINTFRRYLCWSRYDVAEVEGTIGTIHCDKRHSEIGEKAGRGINNRQKGKAREFWTEAFMYLTKTCLGFGSVMRTLIRLPSGRQGHRYR